MKALNLCPTQPREQVGIWRVKLSHTIKNSESFRPNGLNETCRRRSGKCMSVIVRLHAVRRCRARLTMVESV